MAISASSPTPQPATNGNGHTMRGPFAVMTILFFMWGFMTVFNDVLIPRFKSAFELNYFQAMLGQFSGALMTQLVLGMMFYFCRSTRMVLFAYLLYFLLYMSFIRV